MTTNHVTAMVSSRQSADTFRLGQVLCHYRSVADGRRAEQVTYSNDDIMMLHQVDGKGVIGPGLPIDPAEFARSIYRLKKGELVEKLELVDSNVLAVNRESILWWRPAQLTAMWFKTTEPEPRLTRLNGKRLMQPALVFKASRKSDDLDVWALLDNERPTAKTQLYTAPYMNLGSGSDVCLGMARSEKASPRSSPKEWEDYFFDSNFSHTRPRLKYATKEKEDEARTLIPYVEYLEKIEAAQKDHRNIYHRKIFSEYFRETRTLAACL